MPEQTSILVIDDEPENFEVIETLLSQKDYQLHYAESGKDVVISLDVFQPDLILLDVMMPEVDGIEVCQRVKSMKKWQAVPIIMVTALNSKSDLARCLKVGADDFISKPVNALELRARIESLLRMKKQHDQLQLLSQTVKHQNLKIKTFSNLQRNTIQILNHGLNSLRESLTSSFPREIGRPVQDILKHLNFLREHTNLSLQDESRISLAAVNQLATQLEETIQKFQLYLKLEELSLQEITVPNCLEEVGINLDKLSHLKELPQLNHSSSFVIHQVAQRQGQLAQRYGDLSFYLTELEIPINREIFRWIVNELLENALKFSEPATKIKIRNAMEGGYFNLWIEDRGRGMTHEQIANVGAFTQFERRIHAQRGFGLGLAIAKKLTEAQGGRLLISSVYQQGTTVQLVFPFRARSSC